MRDEWMPVASQWVEPWEGCRFTDRRSLVLIDRDWWYVFDREKARAELHDVPTLEGRDLYIPDLTHQPTAREAVARLALFLGAPDGVVRDGVGMVRRDWGWQLLSAEHHYEDPAWDWNDCPAMHDIPADSRPLAIATAWREARKARQCGGR